jgi:hypothetical protein
MRAQTGTSTLRAIVYFDEIFGYMPPLQNPPSKQVILRMLKQARAFGVAQVLVSQNPVDLDYKALSNAGTWMIGKLQTDQDKQRLLDGLQGAMAGGLDRSAYDKLLSTLGKRVFLIHNVHAKGPKLFQTRWAMNYLAGPLTRSQIPALNALAERAEQPKSATVREAAPKASEVAAPVAAAVAPAARPASSAPAKAITGSFSASRPPVPGGVAEYFLPNNLTVTQALTAARRDIPPEATNESLVYRPVLVARASTRFFNRKYNLDYEDRRSVLVPDPDRRGMVHWEDYPAADLDEKAFDRKPLPQARFAALDLPLSDSKLLTALSKDFLDWAYRTSEVVVKANETLKVYAGPEVTQADFRRLCSDAAKGSLDAESKKVSETYDKRVAMIQDKIDREQRELDQDQAEYSQRKMDELGAGLETMMGLFGGRRRSVSKNLTKRRMTTTAKADVDESKKTILSLQKQITEIEKERTQALKEVQERWGALAGQSTEIKITPLKKDVLLDFFGVAWFPYYLIKIGDEIVELPGFASE